VKDWPQITVENRAQLRAWLSENHASSGSIWLVTYKKGDEKYLPYDAIVEEALCFGWIDSLPRKLDSLRTMLLLSPRKQGSAWSGLNKRRVEKLMAAGLMMPAGLTVIAAAQEDGSWQKLDAVEALIVPADLAAALAALPTARQNWDAFPPSVRRGLLELLVQAKRPKTRAVRIAEIADAASRNERARQWRKPAAPSSDPLV